MKKCPKCQRTYTDETLSFCLEDGAGLKFINDDVETVVLPQKKPNSTKTFIAIASLVILLILGLGLLIGLYQFRNQISSLFKAEPKTENPIPNNNPDDPQETSEEQKILNVLKVVRESYIEDDYDKLDTLLADEYVEENSLGQKLTKKDIFSPVQIGKKISLKHSDVKAEVDGDKATATGKGIQKAELAGVEISIRFTFKTKFKKQNGKWIATYSYINIKQ